MLDKDDPNYLLVKRGIDESIKRTYGETSKSRFKIYSAGDFYAGLLFAIGFSVWAYYLAKNDHIFWAFVTGFFGLTGLGGIVSGLDSKKAIKSKKRS